MDAPSLLCFQLPEPRGFTTGLVLFNSFTCDLEKATEDALVQFAGDTSFVPPPEQESNKWE